MKRLSDEEEAAFEQQAAIAAAMLGLRKGVWDQTPNQLAKGMVDRNRPAATLLRDALNEALSHPVQVTK